MLKESIKLKPEEGFLAPPSIQPKTTFFKGGMTGRKYPSKFADALQQSTIALDDFADLLKGMSTTYVPPGFTDLMLESSTLKEKNQNGIQDQKGS